MRGDYTPLVGDFNDDGPRDLVWYRPGPGADVAWFGHRDGRFGARQVAAPTAPSRSPATSTATPAT